MSGSLALIVYHSRFSTEIWVTSLSRWLVGADYPDLCIACSIMKTYGITCYLLKALFFNPSLAHCIMDPFFAWCRKKWISIVCLCRDSYLGNPSFWYRLAHTFTTAWAYSNVILSFWCATAALFTSITEAYLASNSCYDSGEHRGFTLTKKNLNTLLHWF